MRLAVCTLSAVLLSGCSWLGYGGGGSNYGSSASCGQYAYGSQYSQAGYGGGAYGAGGCGAGGYGAGAGGYGMVGQGAGYGANGYGQGNGLAYGQGNGMGGGFGAGAGAGANGYGAGYGTNGYGANGYGVGTGALGLRGVQGAGVYGAGQAGAGMVGAGMAGYGINGATAYGTAGAGTVLDGAAPYGSAAGGQYINGQWVSGVAGATQVAGGYGYGTSGSVTTVQGAPIYVPQPYPAYYGVASGGGYAYGGGLRGGAAALPFGIEAGIGTNIAIGGDIVGAKPGGPALGGAPSTTLNTSGSPAISYGDAYKNAVTYDLAATYDIDPSTTLIGKVGYSNAEGERIQTGTIDNSLFVPAPGVVTTENLYAQWSDLEQFTLEGGARKYMGGWNNAMGGMRPYVQATAGFTHNNQVSLSQESASLMPAGSNVQSYIDAGWTPTASGAIGAEMQIGPRTAIGVEAGIRWSDDLNTIANSEDRWSVPVKLRGRVSF